MSDFTARRVMMVDTQVRPSDVTKFPIIEALLTVPREAFVPARLQEAAYVGENIDLGEGRVMLEARSLAKLLDAMDAQPQETALVLCCGLGYSAAVLGRLVAQVAAVEPKAEFADAARKALAGTNVTVTQAAPEAGLPAQAPFDIILIEGGVQQVPQALIAQLAEGGRIGAIFMQGALGVAKVGHKLDGRINWRFAFNCAAPVLPGFAEAPAFAL